MTVRPPLLLRFDPRQAQTIVEVLRWRGEHQPDDTTFTFLADGEDDERHLTFGELDRQARAIATALINEGAVGNRALLVYDSGLDYIAALYGCLYAGVVAVPVYPPDPFRVDRTLPRLRAIVNDAQATWLLATQETLDWTRPMFSHVSGIASTLATDQITAAGDTPAVELALPEREQPALLQYTSGSTGEPRGVTITHANLVANLSSIHRALDRDGNVAVLWLPVYHDMGLIGGIFQPPFSGRRAILMSPVSFMQRPVRWLRAVSRYRGTVTAAPDFAYELCVRKVSAEERAELDLSCLLFAMNGAEVVRPETLDRFAEKFADCGFSRKAFYPCYGLAEATLMVTGGDGLQEPAVRSFAAAALERKRAVAARGGADARRLVGCGHAVAGQTVAIVDPDTLEPLAERSVGEICVAGGSVAQGYWNRPEETAASFGLALAGFGGSRFLRTGDLGFFDQGELFVAGRLKELIIIQGRNHYPHDIEETVGRSHPLLKNDGGAAFAVDVAGEERLGIVQEVVRPRKADPDALIELIRTQVAEVHGVSPAAVALVPAGTLPKTSSGKKQRRICREQFLTGTLPVLAVWQDERLAAGDASAAAAATPPQTETERTLGALWSDVLGVDVSDVHANFFDLGGQSLLAAQLASRVQDAFGIELPLRVMFSHATVAGLATWLEQPAGRRAGDRLPPVVCADRSQPLALASSQEQLWFLEQLEEEPRYNLSASIRLHGPLDIAVLKWSLATIVARHEALRTSFPADDGRPRQVIVERSPELQIVDRAEVATAATKFDLSNGPLLRASLGQVGEQEHRLHIVAHHLICDGWSLAMFMKELAAVYAAEVAGRQPSLDDVLWHYADFAAWQQLCLATPEVARQVEHWRQRLQGIEPLNLATDRARSAETRFRGAAVKWTLSDRDAEALRELGRGHGATLYMVLLAAFQTWLARYARQLDICVGSPVSYRPRREFEQSIGYFVNMLVMRSDLSGEPTFLEFLSRVRDTVLEALANQDAPFRAVVDAVAPRREAGRSPLFDVVFVFENLPWESVESAGLSLGEIEIDHTHIGSFDVGLVVEEHSTGLKAALVYNANLFDAESIEQMVASLKYLLGELVRDADRSIMRLPLARREDGVPSPSGHDATAREDHPLACAFERLDRLFVEQVRRTPEATAIIDGSRHISYAELDQRANQFALYLQALGVREGLPVAVFLDRSAELVIAMLAILKAGGAYVPFDPHESTDRLENMLADVEPRAIITCGPVVERLPPHHADEIVIDRDPQIADYAITEPASSASVEDLAYIIFTSGSTGQPKGVEISHGSFANIARAMADEYGLSVADRVLQLISPAFDVAVEEIFPTLVRGATLVLGPPTADLTGREILDVCRRQQVTVAHIPSQLWQQCLREWQAADDEIFAHLRLQVTGGETPQADALNRWLERCRGRTRLLHEFGLTETTVTNLVYEVPRELDRWPADRKLPIGRPVAGTEVHVLDDLRQPVPVGAPGELYLGGPGVARGYHRRAELTHERFVELTIDGLPARRVYRTGDVVRWRADGNLEFLGRADEQIKLRGLRIEPGEVERVLVQHPDIGEAAVVARDDAPGGRRLVAYLVPSNGHVPQGEAMRSWLRGRLPDAMVPAAFVPLARLPLNRSHKLDRNALPAPAWGSAAQSYAPPTNEIESTLARIWREALRVDRVGIHDNFFELGGDSIIIIQVVARAREAGLRFTPRQIFERQSIAELAAVEGLVAAAVQEPVEGNAPLTPIQHWFLSDSVVDPQYFNQSVLLDVPSSLDPRHVPQALARLVEQHDALRLRFARSGDGWRQWHGAADGAWPLAQFDLSRLAAAEQTSAVSAAAADLQASLDLERGPLARAGWFDLGAAKSRLLLVAHHLLVDTVSWRFLLEDLGTAWSQLQAGSPPALPPKTSSFKQWAERLADYSESYELDSELAFWRTFATRRPATLPRDLGGAGTYGDLDAVVTPCDAALTSDLVERANAPYRTQTNELLLAALGQTLGAWAGGEVLIDVETHGRETLFDEIDLSRTVGWFTGWHPFTAPAGDLHPGTVVRQIKEALRAVPNHGLGFGVLRYLSPKAEIRRCMAALPTPEVSFNYLGRMDDYVPPGGFSRASESVGATCSPRAVRRHLLEINAFVFSGRLHVEWTFSRTQHRRETIERLAAEFVERLRRLVEHCLSPDVGGFTPSDFPLARLDEAELNKLSELLGG